MRVGMIYKPVAVWSLLFCVALLTGGCTLAGLLAEKTTGAVDVSAKYAPAKERTLLLVENAVAAGTDLDSDQLSRYIAEDLKANNVCPLVEESELEKVRETYGDQYRKMSVEAVGRETGAKQVLWVKVIECTVETPGASSMVQGHLSVKVKVVDVATGTTRWPVDAEDGEPLHIDTPFMETDSVNRDMATRQAMCRSMAESIGKLFHAWKPDYDQ
jgi:hypothetical protein